MLTEPPLLFPPKSPPLSFTLSHSKTPLHNWAGDNYRGCSRCSTFQLLTMTSRCRVCRLVSIKAKNTFQQVQLQFVGVSIELWEVNKPHFLKWHLLSCQEWFLYFSIWLLAKENLSPPLPDQNAPFSLEMNRSCDPVRHAHWCVNQKSVSMTAIDVSMDASFE